MIESLQLKNFRCFRDHHLAFADETIIVGRNNAGKSTLIEALRFISIVVNRLGALSFEDVPSWLDIPRRNRGVKPSLRGIDLNDKTLFYGYGASPAMISATISGGIKISVYFGGSDKVFGVIHDADGRPVTSKGAALRLALPRINILPQIGPLQREERLLRPDYFRALSTAPYQSIHFRNHIAYSRELLDDFRKMVSDSWPGVKLDGFDAPPMEADGNVSLMVRDGGFTAEAGWMGHGLQMWLQIIWFLVSAGTDESVILDEPDVYMHADLQRRLIRLLRNRHKQTIVATHSIEMLSEVPAEHVLIIDRQNRSSQFALNNPGLQKIVDQIGGAHNIQLARLWAAKKFVLVEGHDLEFISQFHQVYRPLTAESLKSIPNMSIGGWSGWPYVIGSHLLLRNAAGKEIEIHCLLDRDYHTDDEINERKIEARNRGIILHIWGRKEIENYILVEPAIQRVIDANLHKTRPVDSDEIVVKLDAIAAELRDDVFDSFAAEFLLRNRAAGPQAANRRAREVIDLHWLTREGRVSVIPGKRAFAMLSHWVQTEFNVSIGKAMVIRAMSPAEISAEMTSVIHTLADCD